MDQTNPKHIVIDEEKYEDIHECLPPIYVNTLDGKPIKHGAACSEAYDFGPKSVVLTLVWMEGDTYYKTHAEIFTPEGKSIGDTYSHQWGSKYQATTYEGRSGKIMFNPDTQSFSHEMKHS